MCICTFFLFVCFHPRSGDYLIEGFVISDQNGSYKFSAQAGRTQPSYDQTSEKLHEY